MHMHQDIDVWVLAASKGQRPRQDLIAANVANPKSSGPYLPLPREVPEEGANREVPKAFCLDVFV